MGGLKGDNIRLDTSVVKEEHMFNGNKSGMIDWLVSMTLTRRQANDSVVSEHKFLHLFTEFFEIIL